MVYYCSIKGFRSVNSLKFGNCIGGHKLPIYWVGLGFYLVDQDFFPAYKCQAAHCWGSCISFLDLHVQLTITTETCRSTLWFPFCPWVLLYKLYLSCHWLLNDTILPLALQHPTISIENMTHNSMIASPIIIYDLQKIATKELFKVDDASSY